MANYSSEEASDTTKSAAATLPSKSHKASPSLVAPNAITFKSTEGNVGGLTPATMIERSPPGQQLSRNKKRWIMKRAAPQKEAQRSGEKTTSSAADHTPNVHRPSRNAARRARKRAARASAVMTTTNGVPLLPEDDGSAVDVQKWNAFAAGISDCAVDAAIKLLDFMRYHARDAHWVKGKGGKK